MSRKSGAADRVITSYSIHYTKLYEAAVAGGPFGYGVAYLHEVLVPTGALIGFLLFHGVLSSSFFRVSRHGSTEGRFRANAAILFDISSRFSDIKNMPEQTIVPIEQLLPNKLFLIP